MSYCVAVTGATGFIGGALCNRLVQEGRTGRALIRSPGEAACLPQAVARCPGDISGGRGLAAFVKGADAVIHCAGNVRGATQAQFDRVNVDGLRQLVEILQTSSPATRLLSLSSLAAREPQLSFYAASKHKGEQFLQTQAGNLNWTAFRPPAVYGPGDKEMLPLLQLMVRGFALIPGSAQARFSLIYIDDLVNAMLAWLRQPTAGSGIFTLEDGTRGGYDWQAMMQAATALSGRPVRRLPVPGGLLDLIAGLNRTAAGIFGYAPMLTPEKLRELRHPNWVCDSIELQQTLDWHPQIQLPEGLRRTMMHS